MKRKLACLLFISFFLASLSPFSYANPPATQAQAVSLIDVESGRILYQKNGDRKLPIASLTKIMTALVAIEHGNLNDLVRAGPNAVGVEGSSIYLRQGERLSMNDLLYGLMLRSGNDAAVAIAEHVGGSIDGFVFLMNQKAEELGLSNTHFANPHGLDHPEHYSTANDLARLTAYALKNSVFQEIVRTRVKTAPLEDKPWERKWYNKNKMLYLYEGADGVKTGYTRIAQRCLVSSATRDGRQLAAVTLNDPNDWNDHSRLLDYGFQEFQVVDLLQKGHEVEAFPDEEGGRSLKLYALREFRYPLMERELQQITSKVEILEGNLNKGILPSGYLHLYLKGQLIGSVPLASRPDRAEAFALSGENLEARQEKGAFFRHFVLYWLLFWRTLF